MPEKIKGELGKIKVVLRAAQARNLTAARMLYKTKGTAQLGEYGTHYEISVNSVHRKLRDAGFLIDDALEQIDTLMKHAIDRSG